LKDKILFFIDTWFTHFGIAKYLQEKYYCDMYSIIDCDDKAKKFFQTQELVKFSKNWYYLDCLRQLNKKPDIEYLKNFEDKYKINLWAIAFTDRDFYLYNRYHQFTKDEILSIMVNECKFFEEILKEVKPDFLFLYMTTAHYHHLLHKMCRKLGIKILLLGPLKFKSKMFISQEPFVIDNLGVSEEPNNIPNKSSIEMQNYLKNHDSFEWIKEKKKTSFEENKWKRYQAILKFFFSGRTESFKIRYTNLGRTRNKVLKEKISNLFKRRYRKGFVDKHFIKKIEENEPFVYFPLHYEPERVLLIDAPYYDNQLSVISNITKSLPVEYSLYVKEHPMMSTIGWRDLSYYQFIMNLPNVKLIHPSVKPEEIISKCSLVITIAGTAGQEAAFYGKPAITFTEQIYSKMSSVYKLKNINELPEAIRLSLQKKVDPSVTTDFVNLIENNSIEFDIDNFGADFAYRFGFKGPIIDAELPIEDVKSYLKENEELFEKLVSEHIKKIKQHKSRSTEQKN